MVTSSRLGLRSARREQPPASGRVRSRASARRALQDSDWRLSNQNTTFRTLLARRITESGGRGKGGGGAGAAACFAVGSSRSTAGGTGMTNSYDEAKGE